MCFTTLPIARVVSCVGFVRARVRAGMSRISPAFVKCSVITALIFLKHFYLNGTMSRKNLDVCSHRPQMEVAQRVFAERLTSKANVCVCVCSVYIFLRVCTRTQGKCPAPLHLCLGHGLGLRRGADR